MSVNIIAHRGDLRKDENGVWKWAGVWAFNSLPKDASLATYNRKTKNPSVRPFVVTWEEARSASDVLVPSANSQEEEKEDTDEASSGETKEKATSKQQKDEKDTVSDVKSNVVEMEIDPTTSKKDGELSKPTSPENPAPVEGEEDKGAASTTEVIETSAEGDKKESSMQKDGQASTKETLAPKEDSDTKEIMKETSSAPENMDVDDSERGSDGEKERKGSKPDDSTKTEDAEKEGESESVPEKKEKSFPVTYATSSPGDPDYTEAFTVHKEKCPMDGRWTGYFENASMRKDRNSSRVQESFCLFFNATPAKDALVLFQDTTESVEKTEENTNDDKSETPRGILPPGHIHVRGTGTNAFGTFELVGSYNIETGLLECQRMYLAINNQSQSSTPRSRSHPTTPRGSRSRGTPDGGDGATPARAYNTRKRQFTWRRANLSEDDDDEMDEISSRRSGSSKKKPRTEGGRRSPTNMMLKLGSKPTISVPTSGGSKRPSPSPRSSGGATSRKRPSPNNKENAMSAQFMKLPAAGDPREARWRAAHFMYYQRNDPSGEETSTTAAAPSYVVYEGEMLQGDCMRDGRGVCLYSNGTIYEGEWKRNKEHGHGTLMSSDRKRIIYKGEWERGRMHGQGTYYYSYDNPMYMRKKLEKGGDDGGSRYEGDFKENARHGVGRYVLPNGSVYDGEWRDNVMSGRGTFYWVDGSVYTGQWKDGKRNGQGTLQTSDGFTYDGQWVQNAMEGRGIATYPNGQQYEGLWVGGRREGRGTIKFTNGAVYEGRFRDDFIEGQGTMKMPNNVVVPRSSTESDNDKVDGEKEKDDWMIPIHFQSDMGHIHQKAGFTSGGD